MNGWEGLTFSFKACVAAWDSGDESEFALSVKPFEPVSSCRGLPAPSNLDCSPTGEVRLPLLGVLGFVPNPAVLDTCITQVH